MYGALAGAQLGWLAVNNRWVRHNAEERPLGKILTVATLKGGSGKSTIASCLGVYWRSRKKKTVLVDADPQSSIARVAERQMALDGVPVIIESGPRVGETAKALAAENDWVVVDTAGFRDQSTIAAITVADMVLVPIKASPLDFDVASDTAALILEIAESEQRAGQPLPFYMVFNQVVRGSVIARHMRAEMEAAGYPLIKSELVSRIIFGEAALSGATPPMIQKNGIAAREISKLGKEIERLSQG